MCAYLHITHIRIRTTIPAGIPRCCVAVYEKTKRETRTAVWELKAKQEMVSRAVYYVHSTQCDTTRAPSLRTALCGSFPKTRADKRARASPRQMRVFCVRARSSAGNFMHGVCVVCVYVQATSRTAHQTHC